MIIEFYGLPGAGKTTIARKLEQKTDFKIVKIKTRKEIIFYNFIFLIKHPIKFFILLYFVIINSINMKEFYYKFMNSFLVCNAKYQKAQRYKNTIIDQGYFQGLLSIFNKNQNTELFKKYIKNTLQPDKLFIFELSQDNFYNRIKKRGYFAREYLGDKYSQKFQEQVISNNNLFNKFKLVFDFVFIINADKKINEVYKQINFLIKK